ncbi:Serine/threonine-protein phosphatase 4 regulatory subunit 1 [Chamberlinius hualienensis]
MADLLPGSEHQGHEPSFNPQEELLQPLDEARDIEMDDGKTSVCRAEEGIIENSSIESLNFGLAEDDDNCSSFLESPDCDPTLSNTSLSLFSTSKAGFPITDSIFNRQMVARSLLDALRSVVRADDDIITVLNVVHRLSDDPEPTVRAELVDLIPPIAAFCLEQTHNQSVFDVHATYLVPLLVKHLSDGNSQVRKTSQSVVVTLMEQKLLTEEQITEAIYPALLELTSLAHLEHHRAEVVALMCRMASIMGKELAEKLFLEHYIGFCRDSSLQVKKMCAVHFGDIAALMGGDITEDSLLTHFEELCKEGQWGIRKPCADAFVTVSCVCSMITRRNRLAPIFARMFGDESRWVRLAIFQALGAFISTFADPNNPFLYYDEEGNIHAASQDNAEDDDDLTVEPNSDSGFGSRVASNAGSPMSDDLEDDIDRQCQDTGVWRLGFENDGDQLVNVTQRLSITEQDNFNCFQYWREPIVDVYGDINRELLKDCHFTSETKCDYSALLNVDMTGYERDEGFIYQVELASETDNRPDIYCNNMQNFVNLVDTLIYKYESMVKPHNFDYAVDQFKSIAPKSLDDIVPLELIFHFLRMTNPTLVKDVDPEVARYCAYSFPAVALTIRRNHWSVLRDLYKQLASDMQWKVRRTLAFSIHELAAILGKDLAVKDLVPIFDSFIRDLDEVRIGILKHLSSFLTLLPVSIRILYLEKFAEFLEPENERNWRFRLELTLQLPRLCPLYSSDDVAAHLLPIVTRLLQDRVAEVRNATVKTVASMVEVLPSSCKRKSVTKRVVHIEEKRRSYEEFLGNLADSLVNEFAHHKNWCRRQVFASCCLKMRKSYPRKLLYKHLLSSLLKLSTDPVANVRLIVAEVIKELSSEWPSPTVISWDQEVLTNLTNTTNDFVSEDEDEQQKLVNEALARLQSDSDRDVRQASNWIVVSPLYSECVPSAIELDSTAVFDNAEIGEMLQSSDPPDTPPV